jgi:hypothetical protein
MRLQTISVVDLQDFHFDSQQQTFVATMGKASEEIRFFAGGKSRQM